MERPDRDGVSMAVQGWAWRGRRVTGTDLGTKLLHRLMVVRRLSPGCCVGNEGSREGSRGASAVSIQPASQPASRAWED